MGAVGALALVLVGAFFYTRDRAWRDAGVWALAWMTTRLTPDLAAALGAFAVVTSVWTVRSFLQTRLQARRLDRWLSRGMFALAAVVGVCGVFAPRWATLAVCALLWVGFSLLHLPFAQSQFRAARWAAAAWAVAALADGAGAGLVALQGPVAGWESAWVLSAWWGPGAVVLALHGVALAERYRQAQSLESRAVVLRGTYEQRMKAVETLSADNERLQGEVARLTEAHGLLSEAERALSEHDRLEKLRARLESENRATEAMVERLEEARTALVARRDEATRRNVELKQELSKLTVAADVSLNLRQSLEYATHIQRGILPDSEEITRAFPEAFVFYRPREAVSGDFYWYARLGEKHVLAAIDCTGHGVPWAFMTFMANDLLNQIVREQGVTRPDQVLFLLDRKLRATLQRASFGYHVNDGMDLALVVVDAQSREVQFSGAKCPLVRLRGQDVLHVKGSRFSIGGAMRQGKKVFDLHTLHAQQGDMFYVYTDGFEDQFGGPEHRKYLATRFRNLLQWVGALPVREQASSLDRVFTAWRGEEPQTDDVLVIGFRL